MNWEKIHELADQMVENQRSHLLKLGRQVIPSLTSEDVLQPNDYPELEENPVFRYEEGILAGLQGLQMALKSLDKSA
ncbi:hypothetical protein [Waddlia chondrophila]|uniref:Uncharacterized protein n=1 Tax=Waddlia chondrophila (strain ATCC VR-1470 / WSU 86-1044) TaxID=716544 RepID=D6YV97_WADCW|nr:hypothetical protein [Waddlia chondrophila]ADI38058.1 conserved hypothetical protein [Waddlia chondrophila WSU 86-1044]